ncbi:MAG: gliding motility-associated C-terminal domain-containing protein [Nonlabens sp.]|uniref:gliding motility-associated C-terminal domain-containing protein n=1 Tax=Nonlabens sp. TaxID=1888209 RepID=UPI003EF4856A
MRYILYSIIFLCSAFAKAQLESSQWYFGVNAGIDFSSGSAMATNVGQLITGEGCTTISDDMGNLLFYTDGSLVYDTTHTLMPNGTGLLGDSSSTSSAIIVPQPGNSDLFYIFTVDTDDQQYRQNVGFHYSIVDMSLNGGTGDVVPSQKNINLLPLTSEKLTAISNATGDGFWVLTQFEGTYYAYELSAAGLNVTPVTSTVGPFIELITSTITNVDVAAMRGYIKLNARGDKLAAAHFSNNTTADFAGITSTLEARSLAYAQGGELYLYDFDNATGVVSNPQPLMTRADGASFYGVEFSGNGKYLYAEADFMLPSTSIIFEFLRGEILQYDLTATNVAASKTVVHTDMIAPFRGALQLGLDNKIYHSRTNQTALSVINNPDDAGTASNYLFNDFPLTTGAQAIYGLPIFVQSFLLNGDIMGDNHCYGENQSFSFSTSAQVVSILWDFGDPSSLDNSSIELNPSHIFSAPGNYTITATIETLVSNFTETLDITVYEAVSVDGIPQDILLCDEGFDTASFDLSVIDAQINSTAGQIVTIHESLEDADQNSNAVNTNLPYQNTSNPQTLFVRVTNDNCFDILSFQISVENCPIEIYNVLTPDGDGLNDTFIVSGLQDVYDKHKIFIFTRYGQKIWEGDNNSPAWDGTSNRGLLYNSSNKLPTGTYFYIIELNEPGVKPIAGYVYLN